MIRVYGHIIKISAHVLMIQERSFETKYMQKINLIKLYTLYVVESNKQGDVGIIHYSLSIVMFTLFFINCYVYSCLFQDNRSNQFCGTRNNVIRSPTVS